MLHIRLVCVGKLREKHFADAAKEYLKRLSGSCKIEMEEVPEARLPQNPSAAEIDAALKAEAAAIESRLIPGGAVIALCIEGEQLDSAAFSRLLEAAMASGRPKMSFVIGSSYGLHESVKKRADTRLSMSRMTFPHQLARIMLLEQLYRGFSIIEGGKYHK
ncbi:MAG: 23S rRNA (pseudouridine(1915)-N(3))-methyltransferase RlmH [Clostridiales bacterium]|nr:23S rRNA (pseudouridine(1915)-N(3))-methyltransferase RlmH [Clostridiales bacterium]